jgi:hypothetical protein
MIPVTTQRNRGTVRHGDFYHGRVALIKGVDSLIQSSRGQAEIQAAVRDSSGGIQKEFNV